MELKNCRAKVYRDGNRIYLMIICGKRKEKVTKCIELVVDGKRIYTTDGRASAELPIEVDVELALKCAQTIGDWFAARLNEEKGRIGYLSEMLVKYITYFACKEARKEKNIGITTCLKEAKISTSRGTVTWKAVYQLFSNTRDLPKELHEPNLWEGDELPAPCQTASAVSTAGTSSSTS